MAVLSAQTATITITGANDDPTVAAAITASASEDGGAVTVDLLDGASDVDNGDVLNVTNVSTLPAGVTLNGNSLEVDPTDAAFQSLAEGETTDIVVTYDIEDGNGGSVAQTATITITGSNDVATIGGVSTGIVVEDGAEFGNKLLASDGATFDYFGSSISVSGDGSTIVVGAYADDDKGNASGSAYIFDRDGNELGKLTASDGAAGDFFGRSISVSGDGSTIVVGAYLDDDDGTGFTDSGSAYIFDRDGQQLAKLTASDAAANDFFGSSISVSGDGSTIVVGAHIDDDNGSGSGSAYIFDRDGNELAKLTASDGAMGDLFGYSISVSNDGSTIVVGAVRDDDNGSGSGSAYIFDRDGNELAKLTASDGSANDEFGYSQHFSFR